MSPFKVLTANSPDHYVEHIFITQSLSVSGYIGLKTIQITLLISNGGERRTLHEIAKTLINFVHNNQLKSRSF